jgi:heat shock protein HslJ
MKSRTGARRAGALLTGALALGAGAAAGEAGPPHPLLGTAWRAEAIGDEAARGDPASTLAFASEGRVAGSGGCNRITGPVSLHGDAITLGPLAATRRACPPETMQQEQRFLTALAAARRVAHDEDVLRLLDADGRELVRMRRIGVASEPTHVGEER